MNKSQKKAIILGAGPSGLACALELIKSNSNIQPIIIEKLPCVGGLSRTVYWDNLGVDIGGHRLYTKDPYIEQIWRDFLPLQNAPSIDDIYAKRDLTYPKKGKDPNVEDDVMLIRQRFSSIIYNSKMFEYPLKFELSLFKKLGLKTTLLAGFSYLKSLFVKREEKSLEDFMINRFGKVLYEIFFKSYTKKVWGVEPSALSSEWGRERIRQLNLLKTVLNAIFSKLNIFKLGLKKETSLIDSFYYPKFGCSQLWEAIAKYIINNGGKIIFEAEFKNFEIENDKIYSVKYFKNSKEETLQGNYFISSIPIKDLIKGIDAPYDIKQNALNLPYRDYILVSFYTNNFNLKNKTNFKTPNNITPECWIYLQEKDAIAARIQIMNNWSPYLVGDFKKNYLISLEYFTNEGDELWNLKDNELINLAKKECLKYNLFNENDVIKSMIIREKKAYPSYFGTYKHIDQIKSHISKIKNLNLIGRNGQHKYNNMDEAMINGISAAKKIINEVKNG